MKRFRKFLAGAIAALALGAGVVLLPQTISPPPSAAPVISLSEVPAYSGEAWVALDGGLPAFPDEDKTPLPFERYTPLDSLGRPGAAYACVGPETMPTGEREGIGMIRPAGWHTVRYDFIDGKYLYNRCHLIGFQLTGENANLENLITGTRYLNVQGMLPFENQVADYVRTTGNHVLYRVTPIYEGIDLLSRGLTLEGLSVEDEGAGLCFHVYAYNVQPGVVIDYATGESQTEEAVPTAAPEATPHPTADTGAETPAPDAGSVYVLNVKSGKFHLPTCSGVATMSGKNRRDTSETRDALIAQGYSPCGACNP